MATATRTSARRASIGGVASPTRRRGTRGWASRRRLDESVVGWVGRQFHAPWGPSRTPDSWGTASGTLCPRCQAPKAGRCRRNRRATLRSHRRCRRRYPGRRRTCRQRPRTTVAGHRRRRRCRRWGRLGRNPKRPRRRHCPRRDRCQRRLGASRRCALARSLGRRRRGRRSGPGRQGPRPRIGTIKGR